MEKNYIQDNVFRYNLGKDITKVETPLKVLNINTGANRVVNAVWDTGASFSSINKRVADAIGLQADGHSANLGISGVEIGVTSFCFAFPGNGRYAAFVEANVMPDVPSLPEFVIGLDIITMGDFSLTRENNNTFLTFIADKSVFMDIENEDSCVTIRKMNAFWDRIKRVGRKT